MSVEISFHLSPQGVEPILGFKDLLASAAGVSPEVVETRRGFDNAMRIAAARASSGSHKAVLSAMRLGDGVPTIYAPNEAAVSAAARAYVAGETRAQATIMGLPSQQRSANAALMDSLGGIGGGLETAVRSKREDAFLDAVVPRFIKGGPSDAFDAAILAKDHTGKNDVILVLRRDETPAVKAFLLKNDEMKLGLERPNGFVDGGQALAFDPKLWINNAILYKTHVQAPTAETAAKISDGYLASEPVRELAATTVAADNTIPADRFGRGWMAGLRQRVESLAERFGGAEKGELLDRERALTGDSLVIYADKAMQLAQHRFVGEMQPVQADLMRSLMDSGAKAGKLLPSEAFANALGVVNQTISDDAVTLRPRQLSTRQLLTVVENHAFVGASIISDRHRDLLSEVAMSTLGEGNPRGMTKTAIAALIDGNAVPSHETALRADGLDKRQAMSSLMAADMAPPHVVDLRLDAVNRYFKERPEASAFSKMEMRYVDILSGVKTINAEIGQPFGDIGQSKLIPPSSVEIDSLRGPNGSVGNKLSDLEFNLVLKAKAEIAKSIVNLAKSEIENSAIKIFHKSDVSVEQKRAWMVDVAMEAASMTLFGKRGDKPMTARETYDLASKVVNSDPPLNAGFANARFENLKRVLAPVSAGRELKLDDAKSFATAIVAAAASNVVNVRRVIHNPRPLTPAHQRVAIKKIDNSRAA